jgi:hypothetical protein
MTEAALQTAWNRQGLWSATASELKQGIARSRSLTLGLVALAAVVEVIAARFLSEGGEWATTGRVLAGTGAAMLAVAALIRSRGLGTDRVRDWIRARSASEALKAAVYLYVTRSAEYAGADRVRALSATVDRITSQVEDLEVYAARVHAPNRELPGPLDLSAYMKIRVESQINDYYYRQAAELARSLRRFRRAELALTVAAAILGAFAAILEGAAVAAWVAALTTLTAAVAAHIEASRYEHLIVTYRGTAQRLEALRDRWRDELEGRPVTAEQTSAFVKSCEDAISVENEGWMAEWGRKKP